jgi:hypothetical protein
VLAMKAASPRGCAAARMGRDRLRICRW